MDLKYQPLHKIRHLQKEKNLIFVSYTKSKQDVLLLLKEKHENHTQNDKARNNNSNKLKQTENKIPKLKRQNKKITQNKKDSTIKNEK